MRSNGPWPKVTMTCCMHCGSRGHQGFRWCTSRIDACATELSTFNNGHALPGFDNTGHDTHGRLPGSDPYNVKVLIHGQLPLLCCLSLKSLIGFFSKVGSFAVSKQKSVSGPVITQGHFRLQQPEFCQARARSCNTSNRSAAGHQERHDQDDYHRCCM